MPTLLFARLSVRLNPVTSLVRRLSHTLALARTRRALGRLDDRLLQDIGLSRDVAEGEAGRPVWDAPPHWRA